MNWILLILLVDVLGFGMVQINDLNYKIESKNKEYTQLTNGCEELTNKYDKLVENPISTILGFNKNK